MYDRIIKGGTIVDGTGDPPFTADVAISGGRIVEIGRITSAARETIDADGLLVTPGWVDIHSHYDGQVTWDTQLAPSFWHGVTTVLMGNCGVGFAPARADQRNWLIGLMEGVEDIPGTALSEGIQWEWESFPEYLDALDRRSWALDVGTQLPHGALRLYVMGERGGRREPATADDIAEMVRLTREAQAAGSFGFSTSRTVFHRAVDGVPVPGTFARQDELYAIARVLAESGHGVLEVAPTTPDEDDEEAPAKELAWMNDVSAETGCKVTFLCLQHNRRPQWWREQLDYCDRRRAQGANVTPQIFCRAISVMLGLRSRFHPFVNGRIFKTLRHLPFDEMVRRLEEDSELRRSVALEGVANVFGAGDPSDPFAGQMNIEWSNVYALGTPPDYEPAPDRSVGAIAARQGRDPRETALDIFLEDGGESFIQYPFMGFADGSLDPIFQMLANPNTIPGAADGGAHVATICDGGVPTFMLTHWVRDRRGERFPLEYIVKKQTADTARLYGFRDRGMVKPGLRADLNLIDFDRLGFDAPRMIRDLPAGGPRLMQKGRGYVATLVHGETIQQNGEDTGRRPGRLVRSGRPS